MKIGIGIHIGPAILGRIGTDDTDGLTALGDTVNLASRLETVSKELGAPLVISDQLAREAGASVDAWQTERIVVRGRTEEIKVHTAAGANVVRDSIR